MYGRKSYAERQTRDERARQTGRFHLRLRFCNVVCNAAKGDFAAVRIEQREGRARIVVARLPHRARVDDVAAAGQSQRVTVLRRRGWPATLGYIVRNVHLNVRVAQKTDRRV